MRDKTQILRQLGQSIKKLEGQDISWHPLERPSAPPGGTYPSGTTHPVQAGQPGLEHDTGESGLQPTRTGSIKDPPNPTPQLPCLPSLRFGDPLIDRLLPGGGLQTGALHEFLATPGSAGAATGMLTRLLGTWLKQQDGPVLWCMTRAHSREKGMPYAPGLMAAGMDPGRLILVHCKRDIDALWVMEEGLQERSLAAVVGDMSALDLTASRRLALKARQSDVTAFLLLDGQKARPTVSRTRWRVETAPGLGDRLLPALPGAPAWQVDLVKASGSQPQDWQLEWSKEDETHHFTVVTPLADRPLAAKDKGSGEVIELKAG